MAKKDQTETDPFEQWGLTREQAEEMGEEKLAALLVSEHGYEEEEASLEAAILLESYDDRPDDDD